MTGAWKPGWHDEGLPRAVALAGTVVLLVLAARLLGGAPRLVSYVRDDAPRVQLVFSARSPAAPSTEDTATPPRPGARPPALSQPQPHSEPQPQPQPPRQSTPAGAMPAAATPARPPARAVQVFGPDGRVQLPATAQGSDRWNAAPAPAPGSRPAAATDATRVLDRPNPVEVRQTRFSEHWISDGDMADVAQQEIARAQRRIAQFLLGKDIEHAQARPSPEVRFNPVRHERRADLGSAATGDAYKAAPISYQPAPGLDGEASRRIREQVAALETAYARCDRTRLRQLMQPLLLHLDELQKVEAAHARGADPIRAEHMLPNAANSAYDLARRALWQADQGMAGCGG